MKCQECGSTRLLITNALGRDCQSFTLRSRHHCGYAPDIRGICSGDSLFPDICLDCGQTQGDFPKPPVDKLEINIPED